MSSQVRARLSRIELRSLKISALPFGLSSREAIAALLALISLILSLVYYSSSLKPEQDRLNQLQSEYDKKLKVMVDGAAAAGSQQPKDTGREALSTLETFKNDYLKPQSKGRIDLIDQINALAKKNDVMLTSGINMTLDKAVQEPGKEKSSGKKGGATQLSVFPNLEATFTVFGQYTNLRNFIGELERYKQFLIINSITLTNIDEGTIGRGSQSSTGSGISLAIEMTAYFQP